MWCAYPVGDEVLGEMNLPFDSAWLPLCYYVPLSSHHTILLSFNQLWWGKCLTCWWVNSKQKKKKQTQKTTTKKTTKKKKKTKDVYSFSLKCKEDFGCHKKCSLTYIKKSVFCFLKTRSCNAGVANCSSFSSACENEHIPFIYRNTIRKYIITAGW